MTQAEKIQKQTERNKRRIAKELSRWSVVWYNRAAKHLRKKIRQASHDGDTHTKVTGDELCGLVKWEVHQTLKVSAVMEKLEALYKDQGFNVIYTPRNGWGSSSRLEIDWGNKEEE